MIEISAILFVSIFFTLVIIFPSFEKIKFKNYLILQNNLNFNILFFFSILNLILFLKIFNFDLSTIIYIVFLIYSALLIFNLFNVKNFKFEKNLNYPLPILFILILIIFIFSIDLANNLTLFWDTQKIWYPKALIFFYDGSISDLKYSDYPHYSFFGSLMWAFFWKVSNMNSEYFGRIFYIVFFCFSILNLINLFKVSAKKKIIFFLLLNLLIYNYWHFRGTQEILVFSLLLICFQFLFKTFFQHEKNIYNIIIIILSLNLILWTKNEGLILILITMTLIMLFSKENYIYSSVIFAIIFALIFFRFYIFKLYGLEFDLSKDFDFKNIISIFYENLKFKNLYFISKYIVFSFLKFPHILLSLVCAFLIFFDKKLLKKTLFLYFYLFLSIFSIFVIYLCSNSNVLEFMVSTGSLRLIFEFSSPYLLFILVFFENRFKKIAD